MSLPLSGKSVLVTRPKHQAEGLAQELERLGATVTQLPVIEIAPLEGTEALDAALARLADYDWLVLTSVNGVAAVRERLTALGIDLTVLGSRKIAAIGPATAASVQEWVGREPDLVPPEYVSESIAETIDWPEASVAPRFLLARADIARKDLANLLREKGAEVDEVAAYRIVRARSTPELPPQTPDYITLTSSSAARAAYEILKENGRGHWFERSSLACIGPITASTVRELGYVVAVEATQYTVPGLVAAIIEHAGAVPVTEKSNA